ncbi:hypothetical protein ACLOJK_012556 [Asimina triloba]
MLLAERQSVEDPAAEEKEAHGVASDGSDEDADVEGHDGEHDEVGETDTCGVEDGLEEAGGEFGRGGLDEAAVGEPLYEECEEEDDDQRQYIHAEAMAWPAGEEDFRILSPEEGHVHHHVVHVWHACAVRRHPIAMHAMLMLHLHLLSSPLPVKRMFYFCFCVSASNDRKAGNIRYVTTDSSPLDSMVLLLHFH